MHRTDLRPSGARAAAHPTVVRPLITLAVIVTLLFAAWTSTAWQATVSAQAPDTVATSTFADVAERANPGVVTVVALVSMSELGGNPFDREGVRVGSGSGFIYDAAGHVVTNSHVVRGASQLRVILYDGTEVDATLVGEDVFQDIAVIRLDLSGGIELPAILPLADPGQIRPGEAVMAIGNPYGDFANTVTTGVINAVDRELDTGNGYSLPNLIQHDADIYPGNSGGPLLDTEGQVVGINVAKAFPGPIGMQPTSGFNFAISADAAKGIIDTIISEGSYPRAYLGISARPDGAGLQVIEVVPGGPADAAGLRIGDVILSVEDAPSGSAILDTVIFDSQPGDVVTVDIVRNGQTLQVEIELGERPTVVEA